MYTFRKYFSKEISNFPQKFENSSLHKSIPSKLNVLPTLKKVLKTLWQLAISKCNYILFMQNIQDKKGAANNIYNKSDNTEILKYIM